MAFDTGAVLDKLVALAEGVSGVGTVYRGAPKSLDARVSVWVTVAGQRVTDKAGGLLQREARYGIALGYRVEGDPSTAESSLADILDGLVVALYAARRTGLDGTVESMSVDLSIADDPRYQVVAGAEFRIYPLLVSTTQQMTY